MKLENEIRSKLLVKINNELNNNKKTVFKSLYKHENHIEHYHIQFEEYFNGSSCNERFISKNLHQRKNQINELDTNYITPLKINLFNEKESFFNNFNSSLLFLRNVCDALKSNKSIDFLFSFRRCKSN